MLVGVGFDVPDGTSWRRWAPALLIVALGLVPLVLASHYGATGLTRNDDWSYSEVLFRWVDTGQLHLNGWVSMFLIGHLVLAWPVARLFPDSLLALQVFTALVGIVGGLAAYVVLRRFLSRGRSTVAVVVMMVGPMWSPLAGSFMTDVPAAAAQAVCLALGAFALRPSSRRASTLALIGALVVGVFGATIREYAIVAPLAVVGVVAVRAAARRDRRDLWLTLGLGAAAAVVYAGAFLARRTMTGSLSLTPTVPPSPGSAFGRSALFTVVTAAFLILPVFAWIRWRSLVAIVTARRWATVAAGAALVIGLAGLIRVWTWSPPLLGPYLDQRGALGDDSLIGPSRPLLLPNLVLRGLLGLTLVATVALVVIVCSTGATLLARPRSTTRSWRPALAALDVQAMTLLFVVASALGLVAVGTGNLPVFDRYALGLVPFAAGLVLAHRTASAPRGTAAPEGVTGRRAVEVGAVVAFALIGLWWGGSSATFDAARWRAGERAVALGYPADRVDAGFEWRNVHRPDGSTPTAPVEHDPGACVRIESGGPGAGDVAPGTSVLFTVDLGQPYTHLGPLRAVTTGAAGCATAS